MEIAKRSSQNDQCRTAHKKETFFALLHTTYALLEITNYCLSELNSSYVLSGKFQTDSLEARFGHYCQLCGGKYDISLRQLYECEKKMRLLSVLKLKVKQIDISLTDFSLDWTDLEECDVASYYPVNIEVCDVQAAQEHLPVLTYIAGYCCYSINKKLQCVECKHRITSTIGNVDDIQCSLIKGLSRGGLLYPSSDMVNLVLVSCLVIVLVERTDFFFSIFTTQACLRFHFGCL